MATQIEAFEASSPRFTPHRTPFLSGLIHSLVLALWVALFASAFYLHGVAAWSTGIAYVVYDTLLLVFTLWQSLALFRRPVFVPDPLPNTAPVPMAVIVAAHNEAAVLRVTIDGLLTQLDVPEMIVLADDGSNDASAAVLLAAYGLAEPELGQSSEVLRGTCRLIWLRLPRGGKARALNRALELVDAAVVVTVDADTLLAPRALGAMRDAFIADRGLVAATGVLAPVCPKSVSGRVFQWFQTYEYIRNFLSRYAWMRLNSLLLISGAFAGFRRSAVLDVGGFDTDCLVEDYELIHRLRRHGVLKGLDWRTAVVGEAFAFTDAPAGIGAFLRQRRRWFGGFLQTQYWYREMVGNRRYGWLGGLMLPVKAFDTLQPVFGLSALFLLFYFLVQGKLSALIPAGGVIIAKIVIDLAYHSYSVLAYRRWIGSLTRGRVLVALLAALAEPFTFQVLRHLGATLGWVVFLGGVNTWGKQHRGGLAGRSH
jgi:cellulose synthase/poly-beta-1,6-N-acetylglucosamine synthase-like glycosyltransferase